MCCKKNNQNAPLTQKRRPNLNKNPDQWPQWIAKKCGKRNIANAQQVMTHDCSPGIPPLRAPASGVAPLCPAKRVKLTSVGMDPPMTQKPFFKFHMDEFLVETECLSKRHRAYYAMLLVLMHGARRASLPPDDAKRQLGLKGDAWSDFLDVLERSGRIIRSPGGHIRQPQVDVALVQREMLRAARRRAGIASGAARLRRKAAAR